MNKNFIKVTDKETAEKLIALGFQLLQKDNTAWTFLNDTTKPLNFSAEDKVAFTNVLSV